MERLGIPDMTLSDGPRGIRKQEGEGGLFVIVSNLVTGLKYFIPQFLPMAFTSLSNIDFG